MEQKNLSMSRDKIGKTTSLIGIIVNFFLAAGKILLGVLFANLSVLADGLNNLMDCGSSIVSMVSFKLSSKPVDKEHPYGHERVEYVCSMAVAFLILVVAFETIVESVEKIITPTNVEFSILIVVVLALSILIKLGLFIFYRSVAKKIDSDILKATATDSITDCIATFVVLVSVLLNRFAALNVDGYAGVFVALFIGYSAIGIIKEIFSKLIGQAPDAELVADIKRRILTYPGVLGVHDLSVYSYGPNKHFASAHIEVDAKVDVLISHELVDAIEKSFADETGIILTGHLDPIIVDDERVNELKLKVENLIKGMCKEYSIHDFRVVFGENRTNVLFDVSVPYDDLHNKDKIKRQIEESIKTIDDKLCAVLTIEPIS